MPLRQQRRKRRSLDRLSHYGMALNPDKSETILLGTRQRVHSCSSLATVNVAGSQIPLADHIKILGVTLDRNLSMNNHVNNVCKSIHYHIGALRHIRSSISEDMAKMVACALVGSRLDYANSVRFGATQKNISKLQKAQNLLARIVTCFPQSSVHVLSSSSSTGSRINTASTSK